MKRVLRGWSLAALLVGLLLGGAVGVFMTASLNPQADTSAIDNAVKELLVTAPVEERPIRQLSSVSGSISVPDDLSLVPNGLAQELSSDGQTLSVSARPVVSGGVHSVGEALHYGDLVAEVSGSPIFAIAADVPIYRDLVEGIEGNDVAGLQGMLAQIGLYQGPADGKLAKGTMVAIKVLYERSGYLLPELQPGKHGMPLSQTASLPADGATVISANPLGHEITEEQPLVTIQLSPAVIVARVDMLQAEAFAAGMPVDVQIGASQPQPSLVVTVSGFKDAEPETPAGYDITVALPEGVDGPKVSDQPVIVREPGSVPNGPAVPLTAIHRDATGQNYVLVEDATSTGEPAAAPRKVLVAVRNQVVGYAILAEDAALPIGTNVIVSGA
ncbi:MAG: hypothetical protein LBV30_02120 [Propionibacteriaceae bacterium]|nr:hypothetical protein [Propionibacteriaceae bacterium]